MTRLSRRAFLATSAAAAGALGAGCRQDLHEAQERVYPQGVASGDPRLDRVTLWTRIADLAPDETATVTVEVATDPDFDDIVTAERVEARPSHDHTVHFLAAGLEPWTRYFYRFVTRRVPSVVGFTRTAPRPDQEVTVRIAVANCQDFIGRWYHAYAALLEEPEVDLVLFLGDYIYETVADPRHQEPTPDRSIALPHGLQLDDDDPRHVTAVTLDDYRALYHAIKADPDLRELHRRVPFVVIRDDHEFANDCWQDVANDFDGARGEEVSTARREAANQAWWEAMPVAIPHRSRAGFPDDLRTWRALRFGANVELFLTDTRTYRDDHVVPEGPVEVAVGKVLENTAHGSRLLAIKGGFDALEAEARPTMLGPEQLAWLREAVPASTARFKLVASAVMMGQMVLDLADEPDVPLALRDVFTVKLDQWDGYRSERAELLAAWAGTPDVVVLSGDLHGAYANHLWPDMDHPAPPTAVEFTTTGVSSTPLSGFVAWAADNEPLLAAMGIGVLVPRFDEQLRASNAHMVHADSTVNGVAVVEVTASGLTVDMLHVPDVRDPIWRGALDRLRFRIAAGTALIEREA